MIALTVVVMVLGMVGGGDRCGCGGCNSVNGGGILNIKLACS